MSAARTRTNATTAAPTERRSREAPDRRNREAPERRNRDSPGRRKSDVHVRRKQNTDAFAVTVLTIMGTLISGYDMIILAVGIH